MNLKLRQKDKKTLSKCIVFSKPYLTCKKDNTNKVGGQIKSESAGGSVSGQDTLHYVLETVESTKEEH